MYTHTRTVCHITWSTYESHDLEVYSMASCATLVKPANATWTASHMISSALDSYLPLRSTSRRLWALQWQMFAKQLATGDIHANAQQPPSVLSCRYLYCQPYKFAHLHYRNERFMLFYFIFICIIISMVNVFSLSLTLKHKLCLCIDHGRPSSKNWLAGWLASRHEVVGWSVSCWSKGTYRIPEKPLQCVIWA